MKLVGIVLGRSFADVMINGTPGWVTVTSGLGICVVQEARRVKSARRIIVEKLMSMRDKAGQIPAIF